MTAKVKGLVPMAFAADVPRSIDFYKLLGMEVRHSLRDPKGEIKWVFLACDRAELMLAIASDPVIASQQAVLFYLYTSDLVALREHLLASRVKVSPITYPDHMPKGEARVYDPDGYCLLIGQPE
jgi:catechol 2,3-dioxygenase-like lactoylglutathione lyase family enzyme